MEDKYIILHKTVDNSLVGVNINEIVVITANKGSGSIVFLDVANIPEIVVNEKPNRIKEIIGNRKKFVEVHTKKTNSLTYISASDIAMVEETDSKSAIIMNTVINFHEIKVNESVSNIVEHLNN